jgi:hypothetical protein
MEQIQGTQEKTSRGQTKSLNSKKINSSSESPTQPKEIYLFIYLYFWAMGLFFFGLG